ncbi:MAG TPA: hypothetical protein VH589_25935 [Trebonia sp.]|jgi:hypothetical protein
MDDRLPVRLPITVFSAAFAGCPIHSIYLSLTSWAGFASLSFTGPANYTRLASDPVLQKALVTTVAFTAVTLRARQGDPTYLRAFIRILTGAGS